METGRVEKSGMRHTWMKDSSGVRRDVLGRGDGATGLGLLQTGHLDTEGTQDRRKRWTHGGTPGPAG